MLENKVVVIGIDGASWNIIFSLIDELPTFQYLLNNGAYGDLQSCIPPVTCPAWKCYSTGKNPGKLGIYWWSAIDFGNKKFTINDSRSFKSKELWDYLSEKNIKVGIINMPTTFPKIVNGFIVAGFPMRDIDEYTYPKEFKSELKRDFDYRINPLHHVQVYGSDSLEDIENIINNNFEVAKKYLNTVDFLHVTIFYIDYIMHFFWNDKQLLLKFYKMIDSKIDELIKSISQDSIIFLMSDHGFIGIKDAFYINEWLHQEGYLSKKVFKTKIWHRLFLNRDNIINITKKIGLLPIVLNKIDKNLMIKLKNIIPTKTGEFDDESTEKIIDFDKSLAAALTQGLIYINRSKLSDNEYEKLLEDISKKLEQIIDPNTKERIVDKIFRKNDIYKGKFLGDASDLVILTNEGYDMVHSLFVSKTSLWRSDNMKDNENNNMKKWVGTHKIDGMFLAYGKNIKKGVKVDGVKIYDLMPTILQILKCPVPKDIDGRLIKEIFEYQDIISNNVVNNENDISRIRMRIEELKKSKII